MTPNADAAPIPGRAPLIRDAILAHLDRPRHAKHVAEHIRRSVPVANGHFRAMLRRGLVWRLETGVYVCAGARGAATAVPAAAIVRTRRQAEMVEFLAQERTADDIAERFGDRPWSSVIGVLRRARKAGLAAALSNGRYVAVGARLNGKRSCWTAGASVPCGAVRGGARGPVSPSAR